MYAFELCISVDSQLLTIFFCNDVFFSFDGCCCCCCCCCRGGLVNCSHPHLQYPLFACVVTLSTMILYALMLMYVDVDGVVLVGK